MNEYAPTKRVAEGAFQRGWKPVGWHLEIARRVESNRRVKLRGYIAPSLLPRVQVSTRIWSFASGIVQLQGIREKLAESVEKFEEDSCSDPIHQRTALLA